jgi:hypothetical protein
MKKILLTLCLLSAAAAAHAQQFQPVTLLTAQTIAATATSNYTAVVNCRVADTIGILTSSTLSGSGTDDIVFKFSKSHDGVTFETTPSVLITNVSNGTTAVNKFSAVDVTGVHTLKLASIVNGSASRTVTNTVKAGVKNFLR